MWLHSNDGLLRMYPNEDYIMHDNTACHAYTLKRALQWSSTTPWVPFYPSCKLSSQLPSIKDFDRSALRTMLPIYWRTKWPKKCFLSNQQSQFVKMVHSKVCYFRRECQHRSTRSDLRSLLHFKLCVDHTELYLKCFALTAKSKLCKQSR